MLLVRRRCSWRREVERRGATARLAVLALPPHILGLPPFWPMWELASLTLFAPRKAGRIHAAGKHARRRQASRPPAYAQ